MRTCQLWPCSCVAVRHTEAVITGVFQLCTPLYCRGAASGLAPGDMLLPGALHVLLHCILPLLRMLTFHLDVHGERTERHCLASAGHAAGGGPAAVQDREEARLRRCHDQSASYGVRPSLLQHWPKRQLSTSRSSSIVMSGDNLCSFYQEEASAMVTPLGFTWTRQIHRCRCCTARPQWHSSRWMRRAPQRQ